MASGFYLESFPVIFYQTSMTLIMKRLHMAHKEAKEQFY